MSCHEVRILKSFYGFRSCCSLSNLFSVIHDIVLGLIIFVNLMAFILKAFLNIELRKKLHLHLLKQIRKNYFGQHHNIQHTV